jgi:hypothetical protein
MLLCQNHCCATVYIYIFINLYQVASSSQLNTVHHDLHSLLIFQYYILQLQLLAIYIYRYSYRLMAVISQPAKFMYELCSVLRGTSTFVCTLIEKHVSFSFLSSYTSYSTMFDDHLGMKN